MQYDTFCCEHVTSFPVGDDEALVSFGRGTGTVRVPRVVADALTALGRFKRRDDHARFLAERSGMRREAIEAILDDLPLLSRREALKTCFAERQPSPRRAISHVGFVTFHRPIQLEETVRHTLRRLEAHSRSVEVVVCDDSVLPEMRESTLAGLSRLARTTSMAIRYAGLDEKRAYGNALERESGIARELIDFALFDPFRTGFCLGANRNCLALDTAGSMLLSLDDDVHARLAETERAPVSLIVTDERCDELQLESRAVVEGAVREVPECLLASLEQMLGRDVADIVRETGAAELVDLENIDVTQREMLRAGRGVVRLASFGLWGDTGADGSEMNLFLPRGSRERLLSSEADYRRAISSREIIRSYGANAITKPFPSLQGFAMAFDQSVVLPPFLPVLRGEDWVFAYLMNLVRPDDVLGISRFMLHHAAARSGRYDRPLGSVGPSLPAVVGALVAVCDVQGEVDRLDAIGRRLVELGQLDPEPFEAVCRMRLVAAEQARARELEMLVRDYGARAPFWADDVRVVLERSMRRIESAVYSAPADLCASRSPEEARATTRAIVRRFGELLRAWPHLVATARRLHQRGIRPSRQLLD